MQDILSFLHESESVKKELRHSWLSNSRQESVAEHTRRMSLMAIVIAPELNHELDMSLVMKYIAIHDLSEWYVWDVPAQHKKRNHKELEYKAMEELRKNYKNSQGIQSICDMRFEYEKKNSIEAKFVNALDKLEVRIQHNEANIDTWTHVEYVRSQYAADKHCSYNDFISSFNALIKKESENKIKNESNKNIDIIVREANSMKK